MNSRISKFLDLIEVRLEEPSVLVHEEGDYSLYAVAKTSFVIRDFGEKDGFEVYSQVRGNNMDKAVAEICYLARMGY